MTVPLEDIKRAGIVGSGGAGFPLHRKLGLKAKTFIVNGAECEPLLETDKEILKHHIEDVISGIKEATTRTGAGEIFLAVKEKYGDLGEHLSRSLPAGITVVPLANAYPVGDEQVLIREIKGDIVPEGGLPLDRGIIVNNVETMYHLGRFIKHGEPSVERFLTVAGEVKNPFVAKVPVGASFAQIIDIACPAMPLDDLVVIDGGPMMGKFVDTEANVRKTTSGILLIPKGSKLVRQRTRTLKETAKIARSACIQCRRCTDLCPRYLNGHRCEPHKWMRNLAFGEIEPNEIAYLCCECGLCELMSCPMDISPRLIAGIHKRLLAEKGQKNEHYREKDPHTREYYKERLAGTERLCEHLGIDGYMTHPVLTDPGIEFSEVKIDVSGHLGTPAKICVKNGSHVERGDVIAECPDDSGVYYHASIPGYIEIPNEKNVIIKRKR